MIKYIPVIFNNKIAVGYQTMFTLCVHSNSWNGIQFQYS